MKRQRVSGGPGGTLGQAIERGADPTLAVRGSRSSLWLRTATPSGTGNVRRPHESWLLPFVVHAPGAERPRALVLDRPTSEGAANLLASTLRREVQASIPKFVSVSWRRYATSPRVMSGLRRSSSTHSS